MASKTTPKKTTAKTKAPAKKAAPAPATTGESSEGAKITLLVDSNPKREGSAAHGRFEKYKTGMTVAAFLAAGGTRSDLRWDSERNYVRID